MTEVRTSCIDAETLAAYAEGKLLRSEMDPVLAHLDTCRVCMTALRGASASLRKERSYPILAIAAAVLIALLAVPMAMRLLRPSDPMKRLVALAPQSLRIAEPRITGGFAWAPWRGPLRAGDAGADPQRLKLAGAAGETVERADRERTPDAQHAAGIALLLVERPDDAIDRLRDATSRDPQDARAWNDLAAALFVAAAQSRRPSLYPEALAAADRALRIDDRLTEAHFNRALILERMGLTQAAREGWQRYLEIDAGSPWANEARERLKRIPASTGDRRFRGELPQLEQAAARGDSARVTAIVKQNPLLARAFGEAEYLGRWGEAVQSGNADEAERMLAVARAIGGALTASSGESLLAEAVRAIESSDPKMRATIAKAHVVYRHGRMTYARQQPAAAEPELRRAAELFARAGSPMALVARYFAACARFDRNDPAGAAAELESLLEETGRHERFLAIGAQVRWELSLCHMLADDWTTALPLVAAAETAFARLGERSNRAFVQTLLGDTLASLGRPDEAWSERIESFSVESIEGRGDRLAVSLGGAARMELRAGRLDAARSLLQLEIEAVRDRDALLSNALMRESVLESMLGDDEAAARRVREARAAASRIDDGALRERAMSDADFAAGAASWRRDPRAAAVSLTRAIDAYRRHEKLTYLPESYLMRARASLRSGDREAAAADLESGIAALERHADRHAGPVAGMSVFDVGEALFNEAIHLALERDRDEEAFAYAERSRPRFGRVDAAPAMTLAELRRRLRESGTALIEIVVLPREVVTFFVTGDDFLVARSVVAQPELAALVARAAESGDQGARSRLFDLLLGPLRDQFHSPRRLIAVADRSLDGIPFGALYDSVARTHLVQRMPVSMAISASSLRVDTRPARPASLVALALPSDDAAPLPEAEHELADVRALYALAREASGARATFSHLRTSAPHADVVHIAGHTQRLRGAGEAALPFAGRGGAREWVSWRSIAGAEPFLSRATVVLSACETLRRPSSPRTFALSLGGAFLAVGARDVIGTLTAIRDSDARELFFAVHAQLAAGVDAAEAVRRVQVAAVDSGNPTGTAWSAMAVLTDHIEQEERP